MGCFSLCVFGGWILGIDGCLRWYYTETRNVQSIHDGMIRLFVF